MYKPIFNSRLKKNDNSLWFEYDHKQYNNLFIIENKFRDLLDRKIFGGFYVLESSFDFTYANKQRSCKIIYTCSKTNKRMTRKLICDNLMEFSSQVMKKLLVHNIEIDCNITIKPFTYAQHVVQHTISFMHNNYMTTRKMEKIISYCISDGAMGCILCIKGRINGRSMSRKDMVKIGVIRRNTYENDISYYQSNFFGKSGCVGVKAWVNRGRLNSKKDEDN